MPLDPLPCHKLSHLPGPPPPSSVTYFTDGPQSADQFCNKYKIGVQLLDLLALADCRRLRVIRYQLKTLPVNITQLHDEKINLTFYSRHLIKFNIISFAESLLVLHHNIIHSRFCKTGYASLFGVGLHNIELNIEIYHPQSSKQNYLLALADLDAALLLNDVIV